MGNNKLNSTQQNSLFLRNFLLVNEFMMWGLIRSDNNETQFYINFLENFLTLVSCYLTFK